MRITKASGAVVFADGVNIDALSKLQDIASRGSLSGQRNKLLNTSGQLIQRGSATIAAGSSAYVFDRWYVTNNTNQSVTVSQNLLALGSGFAMNARTTMRHTFASAPTTGTLRIEQRIEFVDALASGLATFTSWMSGPAGAETLAAEIVQNFGTGGSPSAQVVTTMIFAGSSPTTIYNSSTNRRCWVVTIPSIAAKSRGSAGNDYLAVAKILTPRQAGNYDVTWESFVEGDASNENDPQSPIHPSLLELYCFRYFQSFAHIIDFAGSASYSPYQSTRYLARMRATPALVPTRTSFSGSFTGPSFYPYVDSFNAYLSSPSGSSNTWVGNISLNAEL
ncbi:hypothetical protein ABID16_000039 [Rhizobium aquaticum]|uniref:Uncharacterized protein n=2 Tax=Rhizobium aquaticum TaxID=1549636 RepID=A0ABV2IVN8_9HYPH